MDPAVHQVVRHERVDVGEAEPRERAVDRERRHPARVDLAAEALGIRRLGDDVNILPPQTCVVNKG